MTPIRPRARFLMCRPVHFAVNYAINPWMDPQSWATDARVHAAASRQEWTALTRRLTDLGAAIELVPPAPDVPDLVFTANAAVVLDRQVLLARFRHPERQREEPHFEAAFRSLQARGLVDAVRKLPEAWCSKAPAIASGTAPATCSGWDMARVPMPPRGTRSRTCSGRR